MTSFTISAILIIIFMTKEINSELTSTQVTKVVLQQLKKVREYRTSKLMQLRPSPKLANMAKEWTDTCPRGGVGPKKVAEYPYNIGHTLETTDLRNNNMALAERIVSIFNQWGAKIICDEKEEYCKNIMDPKHASVGCGLTVCDINVDQYAVLMQCYFSDGPSEIEQTAKSEEPDSQNTNQGVRVLNSYFIPISVIILWINFM